MDCCQSFWNFLTEGNLFDLYCLSPFEWGFMKDVEQIFTCLPVIYIARCLFKSLTNFSTGLLLLSFESSLHILHKSPLPDTWFVIFSQSVVCVRIFWTVSLEEQRFLIQMKFNISSFIFWNVTYYIEETSNTSLQRFSPIFSSRSLIVLHLSLWSMV